MLVSDSRKLVFVHIQKTGGVTVDELLWERVPDLRTIRPRHEIAARGRQKLDAWDEYYKFAFVRNPWDRLVSWYSMVTAPPKIPKHGNDLWQYVRDNSSTFEGFILNCTDEIEVRKGVYSSFTLNQLDYLTDENDNLLVDFVGRVENFDEDLRKVFRRIGISLEAIPHKNRSNHRHYSTFYTPETEMIVRERFKRDIEYFGYEFERPPTLQGAGSTEKISVDPAQGAQRRIEVGVNGGPKVTGTKLRAGQTQKVELPTRPGLLFVCGCDGEGTTALADYLNRHPEILISQEGSGTTQQGGVTVDPSTFKGMLDFGPKVTGYSAPYDDGNRLIKSQAEFLANKDPARLRWVGASSFDYVRHMESIAGNNPGARFIVMYRPIEEVAESWEPQDADDLQNSNDGFGQAVKTWNRSLQGTRRFIRDSLIPRVLLVSYHDFFYRTETVVPLISRFLGLEFDESVMADRIDEVLQSERGGSKETLSRQKRSLIQKRANRIAEAWILDRIDNQWKRPGLYTQNTAKAALATSLDEMEAKTWRLQQRVRELERDRERRGRRFKQLKSSRTWRLLNKVSGMRAKIAGR